MRIALRTLAALRSNARALLAAPYSQLMVASDFAGWSLDEDARDLMQIAHLLGFPAYAAHRPLPALRQCVHYTSFFSLADPAVFRGNHRISVDYYHGKPEQDPEFRAVFESMRRHASRITRVRLSYSGMLPVTQAAGIPAERVHLIPIAVNPGHFQIQTPESRAQKRNELGIPQSAVVIGSFQKDGQGWGEGNEPKRVKGPDVFLRTLEILRPKVPELYVLLTGPARGFVKNGLDKLGIPYRHFQPEHYAELGGYFQALDAYLVASREEGGPKAVLESMAAGIPLVTTRVGQAIDIVKHGQNALMAEVEDSEALAGNLERVLGDSQLRANLLAGAASTLPQHTHAAQLPLWRNFFRDYVEIPN